LSAAREREGGEPPQAAPAGEGELGVEPAVAPGSLLDVIEAPSSAAQRVTPEPRLSPGLRTAKLVALENGGARITLGGGTQVSAQLAADVDLEIVQRALENGDRVLVEVDELGVPEIVGVVATRIPRTLHLEAERVIVEASEVLTLRSGKAGMRLREDGDVELVGSRIVTMSRGLFRLVGKMLRLN
jgi:hypothetical protein